MSNKSIRSIKLDARTITGIAIFVALEIALCFITNYVQFGTFNINLALFPIVIGACFYGPWVGLSLGIINGVITIFAPATLAILTILPPQYVFLIVVVCILKTALAGFLAGLFHKLIAKKNNLIAAFVAAFTVPFINTLVFVLFALMFPGVLVGDTAGQNLFVYIILVLVGINFPIEIATNLVIDPAIYKALLHFLPKKKKSAPKKEADETVDPTKE